MQKTPEQHKKEREERRQRLIDEYSKNDAAFKADLIIALQNIDTRLFER